MEDESEFYRGVEWTVENFFYFNESVHESHGISSLSFLYCGRSDVELFFELFPRGVDGRGEGLVLRLSKHQHDGESCSLSEQIRGENLPLPGVLSFVASDGSLLWSQAVEAKFGQLPLCFTAFEFEEVRKRHRDDELTVRLQYGPGSTIHTRMRTTVDAYDVCVEIAPSELKKKENVFGEKTLSLEAPSEIGADLYVGKRTTSLVVRGPAFVATRADVLRDGSVVRSDETERLCRKDFATMGIGYPITKAEAEDGGISVRLTVTMVPCKEVRHRFRFETKPKPGVKVTSARLANHSVAFDDGSAVADRSARQLAEDFRSIDKGHFTDFELKCEGVSFPVHKVILAARSPVFKAMLSCDMRETASGCMDIPDLDPSTLSLFLDHLYTGVVEGLQCDSALKLYYAADKYLIPSLKRECSDFLISRVSLSNVCDVLSLAHKHGDGALKSAAHDFILKNFKRVVKSEEWKHLFNRELYLALETLQHLTLIKFNAL